MITKEFKLDGKVVVPMRLKTHVGMSKSQVNSLLDKKLLLTSEIV